MPEVIGAAVYTLDLDNQKFNQNLAASEAKLRTGIPAAAAPAAAAVSQLEQTTGKLGNTTQKASAGAQALKSAVTQTTSQLTTSVPLMGAFSGAAGSAALAMPLLTAGVFGAFIGIGALNSAVEHFTGSSLIDYITGAAAAHEKAAQAARDQASVEDALARFAREGISKRTAGGILAKKEIDDANAALRVYQQEFQRVQTLNATGIKNAPGTNIPLPQQPQLAPVPAFPDFTSQANQVKDLHLNYAQLVDVIREAPQLASLLNAELEKQAAIAGPLATAMVKYEQAISAALTAQQDFTSALSDLQALTNVFDPQIEALKLEKEQLEQTKTIMGDAFGAENQAHLDALSGKLDILQGNQKIVTESIALFGAEVRRSYGALAPAAIEHVAALLADPALSDDKKIQIAILLPNLAKVQSAFAAFIAALQAGASVQIAVRIAGTTAFPSAKPLPPLSGQFPGESDVSFKSRQNVSDEAQKFIDQQNALIDSFNAAAGASAGATDSQDKQARSAGGLARSADNAAEAVDPMVAGLQAIAANLAKTGRTLEQWNLDEILRPKLEAVQSMLNEIFSKPTKEGLALELKRAQLERRKLLTERSGGDTKSIDAQITSISREIDLRNKDFEIAKLQTELKDNTLQSDQDLLDANQFLGTAMDSLSGSIKGTEDALGVRLFDAALHAASALQAVQAAGGTGFTAAEKHWINGVALANGEPVPFPGFKWGIDFVPRDNMPALLHYGERVLTRQENQQGAAGGDVYASVNGYGRTDEDILRLVESTLRQQMRAARGAGASALASAYVPRRS